MLDSRLYGTRSRTGRGRPPLCEASSWEEGAPSPLPPGPLSHRHLYLLLLPHCTSCGSILRVVNEDDASCRIKDRSVRP